MNKASIASQNKGRKLARERAKLGLSQWEFALQASVSSKTIWCAEQGMPCRQLTKRKIMRALKQEWNERATFFAFTPRRSNR